MKFKKDGKAFEDIWGARYEYCRNITACRECGIGVNTLDCIDFCSKNPAEAARLMGYEVVEEDKQSTTSQVNHPEPVNCGSSKPRICEVLGVEVGEKFRVESYSCILYPEAFIDGDGLVRTSAGQAMDGMRICQLISGELRIVRKPRFTEAEVADARAIMRLCPKATVLRRTECDLHVFIDDKIFLFRIRNDLFPSILPGQSVKISYIMGGDTE